MRIFEKSLAERPGSVQIWSSLGLLAGLVATSALCLHKDGAKAGEIRAASGGQSLGTLVNGGGSCISGACAVTGGTAAGGNLFHRFSVFDTRGSITGVSIQNAGFGAVVVGVTSPLGSFIDKQVALSQPGQLYWLSPGGIALSGGASFPNALQLNLSTATGLAIGSRQFDVQRTTSQQASALGSLPGRFVSEAETIGSLGLLSNGDLMIDGGLLTVEQELLLDAQGGHLLLDGAQLKVPGGVVTIAGAGTSLNNTLVDVSASTGVGGRVLVESRETTILNGATQIRADGERGGAIDLLGRAVTLTDQSLVQASGERGGGSIRIGGDYLGSNPEIPNAWQTLVGPEVQVLANATVDGDGGRLIVWADDTTRMLGTLQARGGAEGGNGGLIETSGKRLLRLGSVVPDASATNGAPGTWLLDPGDLFVVAADTTTATSGARLGFVAQGSDVIYEATGSDNTTVLDTDIENALNGGTNVLLKADNNIHVNAPIDVSAEVAPVLSMQAGIDIVFNAGISSSSPLSVLLDAGGDVAIDSPISTSGGQFAARAGGEIRTGPSGSLNVGFGQVLLQAQGSIGLSSLTAGRVAANSASGDIDLLMHAPEVGVPVEIGPVSISGFFRGGLAGTGVDASNGRFGLAVDGGDGDLSFVGSRSSPATVLAGGTTDDPEGPLASSLSANRVFIESGTRLTIEDESGPSASNLPLFLDAAVEVKPGASLTIVERGQSEVAFGFGSDLLNQGLLSIEAGASISLPASLSALQLAPGSVLSGSGAIVGDSVTTTIVQAAEAIVSPGDGDGRRSLGSLTFENVVFEVEGGAVWRFDLGSGTEGAVDSLVFPASATTLFVNGVPQVEVGLEKPSSPPPLGSFVLIGSPFSVNDADLAAMNNVLKLSDGVRGTLATGSLLFVYQNQSSGGGGGGGPLPPPPPIPPGPGPIPPGPGPAPDPVPPRPDLSLEQLLIAIGTLEPPIFPGNDVRPRPSSLPDDFSDGLASLSINIAESYMGAILSDAAVALSANLDESITIPSGVTGIPSMGSAASSADASDDSLVLAVEDTNDAQAMRSFQEAELLRAAEVTSKLSVKAPPVSSPDDLSVPTLRQQLDQAAKIVNTGGGRAGQ